MSFKNAGVALNPNQIGWINVTLTIFLQLTRVLVNKFSLADGGISNEGWEDLLAVDADGMSKIVKWVHDWCRGNDRLNKVEEFLCTLLEDEVIKSNRMVQVGMDAVAQLLHLRIHCGSMISRRFDHVNFEVNYKHAYFILNGRRILRFKN